MDVTGGAASKDEGNLVRTTLDFHKHHKLANTSLASLQSVANATVRDTADQLRCHE